MKICLAVVSNHRSNGTGPAAQLLEVFVQRITRYVPCEYRKFPSTFKLLEYVDKTAGRARSTLFLADAGGEQVTSVGFAMVVGALQDSGTQHLFFGVGPADGWSPETLSRADKTVAFGRITLPHELAAVVAAEQLYRALTIRAGHPYHSGH